MRRVLMMLIAGAVLSGVAAAYASSPRAAVKIPPVQPNRTSEA